jgi:hypothetical protein
VRGLLFDTTVPREAHTPHIEPTGLTIVCHRLSPCGGVIGTLLVVRLRSRGILYSGSSPSYVVLGDSCPR